VTVTNEIGMHEADLAPGLPATTNKPNITFVDSLEELWKFQRWLGERRTVLAVDTESGGLNPFAPSPEGDIRLVQFGDHRSGWALPWEDWRGAIIELLYGYDRDIALHNAGFDIKWLSFKTKRQWPHWSRTHDTMIQVHLDDTSKPKGLKPTCARFFGNQATAGQKALDDLMKKNKWNWATVPVNHPLYWAYGVLDTILTARLHERLEPGVRKLYGDVYDLEREVLRICTNMSLRGIRIDRDYIKKKITELQTYTQQVRAWCKAEYGIENIGSADQLIKRFKADGVNFYKTTPKGKVAMDKEVLEALSEAGHPLAGQILKVRHAEKIVGSYLENFLKLEDGNGYVHCNINTVAARTGRKSIQDPALQTLHREDQLVRGGVIATEGHSLVKCDADQIEARMMAALSDDAGLINAFKEDGDFFCRVSSRVHRADITDKKDPRRQTTKNAMYALQYGAGDPTMAAAAGIPLEDMMAFRSALKREFHGMFDFMDKVQAVGKMRNPPHVYSKLGRRLVGDTNAEYRMVNYLIQCNAAEVLKANLIELDSHGMGDYMVLPIHDEIILDAPAEEAEDMAREMEKIMFDDETFSVPISWGSEILGPSWGRRDDLTRPELEQ
jgi:DNA polymerase I